MLFLWFWFSSGNPLKELRDKLTTFVAPPQAAWRNPVSEVIKFPPLGFQTLHLLLLTKFHLCEVIKCPPLVQLSGESRLSFKVSDALHFCVLAVIAGSSTFQKCWRIEKWRLSPSKWWWMSSLLLSSLSSLLFSSFFSCFTIFASHGFQSLQNLVSPVQFLN